MGWCSGGSEGGLFLFPSGETTQVCVELEVLVVVVGTFGSLVDGIESVATVVLPAASLPTGTKVKFSSVALPSMIWTLWTVIDVYL